MDPESFPPAPGQGAICIEARLDDERIAELLAPIDHADTHAALNCERGFLGALDGSCRTPIAGHATIAEWPCLILRDDPDAGRHNVPRHPQRTVRLRTRLSLVRHAGAEVRGRAGSRFFDSWDERRCGFW
jgi:hydroxymethylbilane synthase